MRRWRTIAGSGRSRLEQRAVADQSGYRSQESPLDRIGSTKSIQAHGRFRHGASRGAPDPVSFNATARPSGTEPDDQQRQGNADTDRAANDRRRGCKQIFSVTQLTPGHGRCSKSPHGNCPSPRDERSKCGWSRGQFATIFVVQMPARTRRSGCASMVKKRLTASLRADLSPERDRCGCATSRSVLRALNGRCSALQAAVGPFDLRVCRALLARPGFRLGRCIFCDIVSNHAAGYPPAGRTQLGGGDAAH